MAQKRLLFSIGVTLDLDQEVTDKREIFENFDIIVKPKSKPTIDMEVQSVDVLDYDVEPIDA
jgi:hypothetical protein